jgi:hypothetical protein
MPVRPSFENPSFRLFMFVRSAARLRKQQLRRIIFNPTHIVEDFCSCYFGAIIKRSLEAPE